MDRRLFVGGLVGATAVSAIDGKTVTKTYVDSYRTPIAVEIGDVTPKDYGPVTEESVRAELADRHFIAIPSRKSLLRTPELTAKRDILMKLVYTGQISFDMSIANSNDEMSETCLIFFNSPPPK